MLLFCIAAGDLEMEELENLNLSQISFNSSFNLSSNEVFHSTPSKKKAPRRSAARVPRAKAKKNDGFAIPAPPAPAPYQCPHCPKGYKTQRYYKQHLFQHKVKGMLHFV